MTYETTAETSSPATTAHPATNVSVMRIAETTPQENAVPSDAVLFTVHLPEDATLFVNGQVTTSVGNTRQFISRRLVAGAHYAYTVRVEMPRGETPLVEERVIVASAGENRRVSFGPDTLEQQVDRLAKTPDSQ
ncbi:MAG: TIGR03000 domain-containing protein [Pirellulales bacterium]|nr:TIGR03000 domain-containing protein [Pirellulales bacterium]